MKFISPKYSKNQVKNAGQNLLTSIEIDNISSIDLYYSSMEIINNWRASHNYPSHVLYVYLKRKLKSFKHSATHVKRLKTSRSIAAKLIRYKSMDLCRMQDIGGHRLIFKDVKTVELFTQYLLKKPEKNGFHNKKDYIGTPQHTGYRGIHLIYKYIGGKSCYKNMFTELQIRSQIQHSWATAVEIVDTFNKEQLKIGNGSPEWYLFFKYVGNEFARLEKSNTFLPRPKEIVISEIIHLMKKLDVLQKFKFYTVSTELISSKKASLYLMKLDVINQKVSSLRFSSDESVKANEIYLKSEKEFKDDPNVHVVLIETNSVTALKKAYPNYFADSVLFLKNLHKCLQ